MRDLLSNRKSSEIAFLLLYTCFITFVCLSEREEGMLCGKLWLGFLSKQTRAVDIRISS